MKPTRRACMRWLSHRWLALRLALVAVVLTLPSLFVGLQVDDHFQRWTYLGFPRYPELAISRWSFFTFANGDPERTHLMMDIGMYPWWTYPDIRLAFWRPVATLTHWLDYAAWFDWPVLMHAHSLLWFAALVVVATRLYRRLLSPPWLAGFAALLFAIDHAHGFPVGWLANRNAVLATLFGLAALLAHDRWRRERWRGGGVAASVLLVLGLLSAEAAIACCAYLLAYALVLDKRPRALTALLPYGGIVVAWQVVYRLLGHGAHGSALYIHPLHDPARFAVAVVERGPLLLLSQWGLAPIDVYVALPNKARLAMWLVAVAFIALLVVLLRPILKRSAQARFFGLGMLLAVVPVCATFPMDRLLMFIGFGAMGLMAELLATIARKPSWWPQSRWFRRSASVAFVPLVAIHLLLAPLLLPLRALSPRLLERVNTSVANAPKDAAITRQTMIAVSSPDPYSVGFLPAMRAINGQLAPRRVRRLASSWVPIEVTRPDAHTLLLRAGAQSLATIDGPMVRSGEHPLKVGERIQLSGVSIEVLEIDDDGMPVEARFRFDVPLEDPSLRWVIWRDEGFQPFALPAIGESQLLRPPKPF